MVCFNSYNHAFESDPLLLASLLFTHLPVNNNNNKSKQQICWSGDLNQNILGLPIMNIIDNISIIILQR